MATHQTALLGRHVSDSDVEYTIDVVPTSDTVVCSPARAMIFARSKRALSVTCTPQEAGQQQFRLCCRMKPVDKDGEALLLHTQESELLR